MQHFMIDDIADKVAWNVYVVQYAIDFDQSERVVKQAKSDALAVPSKRLRKPGDLQLHLRVKVALVYFVIERIKVIYLSLMSKI